MILTTEEKMKDYTEKGWWGTKTVQHYLQQFVESSPTKTAVIDPLNKATLCNTPLLSLTYEQLQQKIDQVASALNEQGIGKDDIVAIQLPNVVELVISYFAILKVGAISSPIPIQYREFECLQLLQALNAKAVVTMQQINDRQYAEMYAKLQDQVPSLNTIFTFDGASEVSVFIDFEQQPIHELPNVDVTANDIFTICWTSGTEGKPKGVPRSHNEWLVSAYASVDAAKLSADDRILLTFPLVNMAGIGGVLVPWVVTGGTLVLHHPFDFPTFLAQIGSERITYTLVPPSLLTMMIKNQAILSNIDISALRAIGTGSAPITPWLIHSWKDSHGVDLINYFGSNEGATFLSDAEDVPDPQLRSIYLPRFGPKELTWHNRVGKMVESKLIDVESGEEITEPNHPGELLIRGPGVFSGYWQAPEINEKAFDAEGYFRSGDLFEIIHENGEDRYYRVVGRLKDIIVRSGMKISPLEIEEIIQEHPSVVEVAVIPHPHRTHGEISCACIVVAEGQMITLEDVKTLLIDKKIASFKLPEKLMIVNALPRNAVGKVMKSALIDQLTDEEVGA
ncbi:class I adenylate-forming enzyme family protein [Solibacillus sp. FSL H8-0523]|uniref:class I adenylate-forming enzyme family protein n=1 Tax=Solibacillus sp. FSL H8-0523 TaxID=2954511 RepID=UPI0031017D46